jgi:prepilin-type N-terminal cleavage/methylation domain-containing protein
MKRKPPFLQRRLPIDFGDEPLCPVPIQNIALSLNGGRPTAHAARVNGNHETASPSSGPSPAGAGEGGRRPGEGSLEKSEYCGEGRGEGGLNFYSRNSKLKIQNSKLRGGRGFTLIEIMVVLALLSLITFALMAVFSSTQRAFRASLTQSDTLEGGRAVIDLIAGDLETMTPSYDVSNYFINSGSIVTTNAVNFSVFVNANFASPPAPLIQSLVGSPDGATRTNVLENIFILGKANLNGVPSWIATGYFVNTNLADGTLYPLYRFYMTTNAMSGARGENGLYNQFTGFHVTNNVVWSHLMDGVVNLTAHAYDTNGVWITNGYYNPLIVPVQNVALFGDSYGELNCLFFSNAVPASVQIELGTLEDRTMEHAEGLSGVNQSNYLANSAGQLHLFTRRVWIRNLDPTAYQ